jgi:hypothetical protein
MRGGFAVVLIPFLLACFALSPRAQAVTPAPDGGYPNGNTAEGDGALFNLTTGLANTATGSAALRNNTTGDLNTANGADTLCNMMMQGNTPYGCHALESNTGLHNTAIGTDGTVYAINDAVLNAIGDKETAHALKIREPHVITVTGKAFYDIGHAPADHSNRRRTPKDYAVWEIHPVMKMEVIP